MASPGRGPRLRSAVALLLLLAIALAGIYVGFRLLTPRSIVDLDQTRRARRVEALASYAGRERYGSLLPRGDVVLALREDFLQIAVERSLPYRQEFEDGRYVARLDAAVVRLEDGLAEISLLGRGMLAGREDTELHVDLILHGAVSVVEVDPDSGTLAASVVIQDVEVERAGPREVRKILDPATRYFSRLRAEDWNRQRRLIRLPLRMEREVVLPAIDGDVRVPESRVPVAVGVSAVTSLGKRMLVSLALRPDPAGGEPPAPPPREWNAPAGIEPRPGSGLSPGRLAAEERRLRHRVERLAERDPLWRSVTASNHDVVVLVPDSVLATVVQRVARRYLRGVSVDFRPELTARIDEELHVRILGNRAGAGRIRGTVHVGRLQGRLTVAAPPRVRLVPPRDLTVEAPVRVLAGRGSMRMEMEWDPAWLVGLVCRGFRFEESLTGEILPLRHELTSRVRFAVLDTVLVGRPSVQRDRVRMPLSLTPASWARVRRALVEQDRLLRCGTVMDPDRALGKLSALGQRGIRIRLPARIFPAFRLPLALENEYTVGDYRIAAHAYDPAIAVRADHLRFAFRARLRLIPAPEPRP